MLLVSRPLEGLSIWLRDSSRWSGGLRRESIVICRLVGIRLWSRELVLLWAIGWSISLLSLKLSFLLLILKRLLRLLLIWWSSLVMNCLWNNPRIGTKKIIILEDGDLYLLFIKICISFRFNLYILFYFILLILNLNL